MRMCKVLKRIYSDKRASELTSLWQNVRERKIQVQVVVEGP